MSSDEEIYEERLQRDEKRLSRADRKRLREKDRSKYRKSDVDQQRKRSESTPPPEKVALATGRVLSITGTGIVVESGAEHYLCNLRGHLKKERQRLKTLITVGDIVQFEPCPAQEGHIWVVEPRRTVLSRADNLDRQKEQILAANIDQVLITTSVVIPPLKPAIIDRYIIAARAGGIDPIIIVNKIDMLAADQHEDESLFLEEARQAYAMAGVPLLCVSAASGAGLTELRALMHDKASVFSGQSGVGKSSLINALFGTDFAISEAVARTKKGSHTTTTARLVTIPGGGWVVDTPGVRSFGLWQLTPEQVHGYYEEIFALAQHCQFRDCTHTHEGGCAVVPAVEEGLIHPMRYDSYVALLEEFASRHRRR